ncbi:MAG: bifunctional phosphopantothenoylcysteine decarboxylase/phosphopantothenate--cysteine ligase CoaBC [Nitrosopumilus sp. H8]|nr:MAG: bifunctional phosphopantothenoylcysteine decarboxylase/phosphopantothenate--cysteine ligase CoaBC [Nitrosopumilus sp. H8]
MHFPQRRTGSRWTKARQKRLAGRGHPSLDIVDSHGTELAGKKIALCVAGSVAAYKAIELARLLMRHGADVTCVASGAAARLVRPDYFKWATGNDVITKLTGDLEHIKLADYGRSDLIIVYPATANTLGKLANGIDDTPVSTVLTVGFGSGIPILVCLAMHESMYENSAVKRNMRFLKDKIEFLSPSIAEGKAKAPEPEDVLEHVLERFGLLPALRGKKVLVTAGSTAERVDPVRIITNQSSGRTGASLAAELVSAGARVTLVWGTAQVQPPRGARVVRVSSGRQMHDAVRTELKKRYDIVIMAAAVSDYVPVQSRTKIKSSKDRLQITLRRAPKIIDSVKKYQSGVFLVGFKAEAGVTRDRLVRAARKKMAESRADLIVANDIGTPRYKKNPQNNQVVIVDSDRAVASGWMKKQKIARFITRHIGQRLP